MENNDDEEKTNTKSVKEKVILIIIGAILSLALAGFMVYDILKLFGE